MPGGERGQREGLDHPKRERIYGLLSEQPGLNWHQIKQKTGYPVGTVLFHLEKLEDAGSVIRRESTNENEVLFFTEENKHLWLDPSTRVLFGSDATRRVADAIARDPGASISELAERLDQHPNAIRYHVRKLDDHKLLLTEREGRTRLYAPTQRLEDWIESFGER